MSVLSCHCLLVKETRAIDVLTLPYFSKTKLLLSVASTERNICQIKPNNVIIQTISISFIIPNCVVVFQMCWEATVRLAKRTRICSPTCPFPMLETPWFSPRTGKYIQGCNSLCAVAFLLTQMRSCCKQFCNCTVFIVYSCIKMNVYYIMYISLSINKLHELYIYWSINSGMFVTSSDISQEGIEEDLGAGCEISLCQWVQNSNRDSEDWWSRLPSLEVDPTFSQLWKVLLDALQSLAGKR